jgi:hypothetical protein
LNSALLSKIEPTVTVQSNTEDSFTIVEKVEELERILEANGFGN